MGAQAAVFDWDGTLVCSGPSLVDACREATSTMLGQTYPATPQDEQLLLQLGEREALRMLCADTTDLERLCARFRHEYERRNDDVVAYPGIHGVLQKLRQLGWKIGLVSNGERARVTGELRRLALDRLVDVAIFSSDTDSWIPNPEPLLAAMKQLGADPRRATFIGDSPADITAGRAAGMRTVAAVYGHENDRTAGARPDSRAVSPAEILDDLTVHKQAPRPRDGRADLAMPD